MGTLAWHVLEFQTPIDKKAWENSNWRTRTMKPRPEVIYVSRKETLLKIFELE